MLSLPSSTRVFVCRIATDMRCSFNRLSGIAKGVVQQDPLSGHLFVFLNRTRTHVKVLYFDRTGLAIWYKRLERGTFTMPSVDEIGYRDLVCVLEGLEITKKSQKVRYNRENILPRSGT